MNDSQSNILRTPGGLTNQDVQQGLFGDSQINDLLSQVSSGKMSLADAMQKSGHFNTMDPSQQKGAEDAIMKGDIDRLGGNGIAQGNTDISEFAQRNDPGVLQNYFMQRLATDPNTGGQLASYDVQNNPLLSQGLDAEKGQLQSGQSLYGQQGDILKNLQTQGFNLTPQDQSLYGQESGAISRQFGSQGNDVANNLASRGLSSSGAAGAAFSGLQGSQNEMLAQAQQQIAQQRFQNTMGQIGQQQQFMGQLGAQNNAMAGQYANTAGSYQNQAYNQNLAGIENQQKAQNDQAKNSLDYQSLNQNEGNEQFSQRQATSAGSALGGLMGGIGSLAGGAGAIMSGAGKLAAGAAPTAPTPGGSSPGLTGQAGSVGLPWGGNPTSGPNYMGPQQPNPSLYGPAY